MTSGIVSPRKKPGAEDRRLSPEQAAAAAMVAEARQRGLALTGPDGLLEGVAPDLGHLNLGS